MEIVSDSVSRVVHDIDGAVFQSYFASLLRRSVVDLLLLLEMPSNCLVLAAVFCGTKGNLLCEEEVGFSIVYLPPPLAFSQG